MIMIRVEYFKMIMIMIESFKKKLKKTHSFAKMLQIVKKKKDLDLVISN